ncbi:FimD/PapC N-terminal domain-containing protein, partial [Escherichia coli]|uniref:FimD/PapC N-terminal domain-containing protein n=1 Tax=Escherichia coli TaxID=562 RepID=UPI0023B89B71
MPDHSLFRLRILPWCIALAMSGSYSSVWAEDDIQFDSRFLELKGDTKIDLKRFSSQGYVEPGKYNLQVQLNKQPLAGNDSNLLIVFYVQIMPDDFVMQLHR